MQQSKKRVSKLKPIENDKHERQKPNEKGKMSFEQTLMREGLHYLEYDTLKNARNKDLYIETDVTFAADVRMMAKARQDILQKIVNIGTNKRILSDKDCEELNYRAILHEHANIVNVNTGRKKQDIDPTDICNCGCGKARGPPLSLCSSEEELGVLGSGVVLLMVFFRMMSALLLLFAVVFSGFALVTNIMGTTNPALRDECDTLYCVFRDNSSDQNKLSPQSFSAIQLWLGVGYSVLFIFVLQYIKIRGREIDEKIDTQMSSAADFAIKIENLPYGSYSEKQLIQYFERISFKIYSQNNEEQSQAHLQAPQIRTNEGDLADSNNIIRVPQRMESVQNDVVLTSNQRQEDLPLDSQDAIQENSKVQPERPPLSILLGNTLLNTKVMTSNLQQHSSILQMKSIQIIYNMEFCRALIDLILKEVDKLASLLKEGENKAASSGADGKASKGMVFVANPQEYRQAKNELIKHYEMFEDLRKQFLTDAQFRKRLATTCCIVELKTQEAQKFILKAVGNQKNTLLMQLVARIRTLIFGEGNVITFKGTTLKIQRAPQPTDILWTNCEKRYSLFRMLAIYTATLVVILVSFGLYTGLDYIQSNFITKSTFSGTVITILNFIMSILLQLVNTLLWKTIFVLLTLEYNHTQTEFIASHMGKALWANSINVIVVPIIAQYILKGNFYGSSGLSGAVFDYQFSLFSLELVNDFLKPGLILKKVIRLIRSLRNFVIRFLCRSVDRVDPSKGEPVINEFFQQPAVDIANLYNKVVVSLYHAAFFCTLQPSIIVFVSLLLIQMYVAHKYLLIRITKMPAMVDHFVYKTAISQSALLPLIFGTGAIFNNYVAAQFDSTRPSFYLPNFVVLGVGAFCFANPRNVFGKITSAILNCRCQQKPQEQVAATSEIAKPDEGHLITRIDTYYRNSNLLSMLGFESIIANGNHKRDEEAEGELQRFCESFFPDYEKQVDEEAQMDIMS